MAYIPKRNYDSWQALWDAFVGAVDFWGSTGENEVTLGDITITFDPTGAGYNRFWIRRDTYTRPITSTMTAPEDCMIASSENAIILGLKLTDDKHTAFILNKNSDGKWSAAIVSTIPESVGFLTYNTNWLPLAVENEISITTQLTQLAPIISKSSSYVFENGYIIIAAPQNDYTGLVRLNGRKYMAYYQAMVSYE